MHLPAWTWRLGWCSGRLSPYQLGFGLLRGHRGKGFTYRYFRSCPTDHHTQRNTKYNHSERKILTCQYILPMMLRCWKRWLAVKSIVLTSVVFTWCRPGRGLQQSNAYNCTGWIPLVSYERDRVLACLACSCSEPLTTLIARIS